jgi:hypothetical protein
VTVHNLRFPRISQPEAPSRVAGWRRRVGALAARAFAAALVCWGIAGTDARAQGADSVVAVISQRPLAFGGLVPGLPLRIAPDDPRAGVLEFRGRPGAEIRITLVLPDRLQQGATAVGLRFGGTDGLLTPSPDARNGTRVDPQVPFTTLLSSSGSAFLFLGATATALPAVPGGDVAGLVVARVVYTGSPE